MTRYYRLEKSDDIIPGLLKADGTNKETSAMLTALRLVYSAVVEITAKEARKIQRQQRAADEQAAKESE